MAIVRNAVQTLPKVSTARVGSTSVTDRQKTGRREHEFTFAKNSVVWGNY